MDKFSICIVDDDEDDLEILQSAFHELDCAASIEAFLRIADFYAAHIVGQSLQPDVIILDYRLNGLLATDVIATLRADHRFDVTVIAVYSSSMTAKYQLDLFDAGADLCFTKGSTMDEIKLHLNAFCEAVQKRRIKSTKQAQ